MLDPDLLLSLSTIENVVDAISGSDSNLTCLINVKRMSLFGNRGVCAKILGSKFSGEAAKFLVLINKVKKDGFFLWIIGNIETSGGADSIRIRNLNVLVIVAVVLVNVILTFAVVVNVAGLVLRAVEGGKWRVWNQRGMILQSHRFFVILSVSGGDSVLQQFVVILIVEVKEARFSIGGEGEVCVVLANLPNRSVDWANNSNIVVGILAAVAWTVFNTAPARRIKAFGTWGCDGSNKGHTIERSAVNRGSGDDNATHGAIPSKERILIVFFRGCGLEEKAKVLSFSVEEDLNGLIVGNVFSIDARAACQQSRNAGHFR